MITPVADTSFIVALGNAAEKSHVACEVVKRGEEVIIVPQTVLAEVGYLFTQRLGNRAMANFLRALPETKYRIMALESVDFVRTAELLEKYTDSRVDFVDATVAALAERLQVKRILTIDQRDFQILRPKHVDHFELLP
ncbi:MAG: PIN domain-containing protein [Chloroflexota bacterium]